MSHMNHVLSQCVLMSFISFLIDKQKEVASLYHTHGEKGPRQDDFILFMISNRNKLDFYEFLLKFNNL